MDVFEAIADPVRRVLLRQLAGGPGRVVDLAREHPISRPAISRHLRLLEDAGLVAAEARGRERHYELKVAPLEQVAALLAELRPATGPLLTDRHLDALETEVRRTARDRRRRRTADPIPSTSEKTA